MSSKRAASKSPEPTVQVCQEVKICGQCHKPKVGMFMSHWSCYWFHATVVLFVRHIVYYVSWFDVCLLRIGALATAGKIQFMSTHKDICPGKCNETCTSRTDVHVSRKRRLTRMMRRLSCWQVLACAMCHMSGYCQ